MDKYQYQMYIVGMRIVDVENGYEKFREINNMLNNGWEIHNTIAAGEVAIFTLRKEI